MEYSILHLLCLLGSVCMFLYGMKVMSEGLQKAAGERLRSILSAMTRNRATGTVTGVVVTALVQSSSASTVMVVSFVNAGLMTLTQAMSVIMGANLGTTFTPWMIALFGFKVSLSSYMLPLLGVGVIMLFTSSSRNKSIGEFLIGFSFLFMSLDLIQKYVPDLQSNPDMFAFLQQYTDMGFGSVLIFTMVGLVATLVVQSSAATFAVALVMCAKGWIDFNLACALVLGASLGTTITPLLASLSGNTAAKRAAVGHLLFNVCGVLWMLPVFHWFVPLVQHITMAIGQGDPTSLYTYIDSLAQTDKAAYQQVMGVATAGESAEISAMRANIMSMQVSVGIGMSMFYTVYKICNLSVMIWFTHVYVKVVEWLLPSKKQDEEFNLKYIGGTRISSSELTITQAEKEIGVFALRVDRMVGMSHELLHLNAKAKEFNDLYSRLGKYEDISDRMEREIADFLNRTSQGRLSNESKRRVAALFNINSELESIGDGCYNFGRVLSRKQEVNVHFNDLIKENIDQMFVLVAEAMEGMINMLNNLDAVREEDLMAAYNKEREINNLRNQLRAKNVENINNGLYDYQAGIFYMDAVADLEKVGDYAINIVDTIRDSMVKN